MRPARAAALAAFVALGGLAAGPASALAEPQPFRAGVSVGRSSDDRSSMPESNRTLGLWARVGVGGRLAAQFELQQISAPGGGDQIRSGTALLAIDLISAGPLVPLFLAGAGMDRASLLTGTFPGRHFEGGLAIEYRAAGGLVIGVDARFGGRSIDSGDVVVGGPIIEGDVLFSVPAIQEGEYFATRLAIGARF